MIQSYALTGKFSLENLLQKETFDNLANMNFSPIDL